MNRPRHLPDYENPPLNEVVLGVQFSPPRGYQQIDAKDIWELFRQDFPEVTTQLPLAPSFETFGRPQRGRSLEHHIPLLKNVPHPRYWFISEDGDELIQFQNDRLLHNWRRIKDKEKSYPHFESLLPKFENELHSLEEYFYKLSNQNLNITQCELTYISHILLTEEENGRSIDKWIRLINLEDREIEDFLFRFRKRLNDENGNPYGRFIGDCRTGINPEDQSLLLLDLTVRGIPREPNLSAGLDFLRTGREIIVMFFDNMTTEFAHSEWGRK